MHYILPVASLSDLMNASFFETTMLKPPPPVSRALLGVGVGSESGWVGTPNFELFCAAALARHPSHSPHVPSRAVARPTKSPPSSTLTTTEMTTPSTASSTRKAAAQAVAAAPPTMTTVSLLTAQVSRRRRGSAVKRNSNTKLVFASVRFSFFVHVLRVACQSDSSC